MVGNRECNTERGFKNQLYIELGYNDFDSDISEGEKSTTTIKWRPIFLPSAQEGPVNEVISHSQMGLSLFSMHFPWL